MINSRLEIPLDEETIARVEKEGAMLRFGYPRWLRPFVLRGVRGLALGSRVYIDGVERFSPEALRALVRHELVHVRQARRDGLPRFLWRYLYSYLSGRLDGKNHWSAYREIPYEVEARREEEAEVPKSAVSASPGSAVE